MTAPSIRRQAPGVWFMPSLLMVCTTVALAVGLLYDGAWDLVASLLLAVPVISFVERCARRQKR